MFSSFDCKIGIIMGVPESNKMSTKIAKFKSKISTNCHIFPNLYTVVQFPMSHRKRKSIPVTVRIESQPRAPTKMGRYRWLLLLLLL